jgi:hypothetical protein
MNTATKTYDLYEVIKIPFPFTDIETSKVRPALILSSAKQFNAKVGSSVMAMITSMKPSRELWPLDIPIHDLSLAGLPIPSIIEPIPIKSFSRFFGSFEPIFDSRLGGQYRHQYMAPQALKSKSGQNNPKTRRKILTG